MTIYRDCQIHETATVEEGATLGVGVKVWHYAHIRRGAQIGDGAIIGKGVYVDHDVMVGANCSLQNNVNLYYGVVLEDGVFFGPNSTTTNNKRPRAINSDGTPVDRAVYCPPQATVVRFGAIIGAGAVLVAPVEVGQWAVVGAGSVVCQNVLAGTIVVGNPARRIGFACYCGRRIDEKSNLCRVCAQKGTVHAPYHRRPD